MKIFLDSLNSISHDIFDHMRQLSILFVFVVFTLVVFPVLAQQARDHSSFDSLILLSVDLRYVDWDSSYGYLEKARLMAEPLTEEEQGMIYNQKGALYYLKGDYPTSLKFYSQALEIFEEVENTSQMVFALNGRGLIYLSQHEYNEAIQLWKKCAELNLILKDSMALAVNYFNIGIAESDLKDFGTALSFFDKSLDYLKNYPEKPLKYMAWNRLGKVYFELDSLRESEKYYRKVLGEEAPLNNWELTFAHTGLAEIALKQSKPGEALVSGLKALESASKLKAAWDLERATGVISKAYEELGQYQNALRFARINKQYSDSLYNENKNSEISYLQLKLTEADNQVLINESLLSSQKAKTNGWLLAGLSTLLVALAFALFLYRRWLSQKEVLNEGLRSQQLEIISQNDRLKTVNQEKNKLFSILSHDLRSPISSIKQVLEVQELGLLSLEDRQEADSLLLRQISETEKMLDDLLQWSHSQLEGILTHFEPTDLNRIAEEAIAKLGFTAKSKNIEITFTPFQGNALVNADPQQLKIILQNCLQNACKFSFNDSRINLWVDGTSGNRTLHIQDFGVGIPSGRLEEIRKKEVRLISTEGTRNEKGTGLGLVLVKQFMAKNNGRFEINSSQGTGTKVALTFERYTE